jgi:hypothetical protein
MHIVLNMTGQYYIGFTLEAIFGIKKFITIYIISGIGGNFLAAALNPMSLGVGASTSLFGLMHLSFLYEFQNTPNKAAALLRYRKQVLFSFAFSLLPGISLWGHLGGFFTGIMICTILIDVPITNNFLKLKKYCPFATSIYFCLLFIYIMKMTGLEEFAAYIQSQCGSIFNL